MTCMGAELRPNRGAFGVLLVLLASCSGSTDSNSTLGGDPAAVSAQRADDTKQREVRDGPFGIAVGMPLSELSTEGAREAETGLSILKSPPSPNSQFPQVAVISFPETGVCEVRALSPVFESDPYIVQAGGFADQIAEALNVRYGKGVKRDDCAGYSCDSEYKLQHIESGGRYYGYEWRGQPNKPLPSRVTSIDLTVMHERFNNSQVRLDYRFDNSSACAVAARKAKAGNL